MLAVVSELPPQAEPTGLAHASHPLRAIAIAVALPLLAVGIYLQVGAPRLLADGPALTAAQTPAAAVHSDDEAGQLTVEQMVARLQQRLRAQPDDIRGWLMLGRSYSVMNRHEDARAALAQARERAPDDADVMVSYAEVLTTLNKGSLEGEPIALVNRALAIKPDIPRALWLAGVHARNQDIPSQALSSWQKILDATTVDSSVRTQVTQAMNSVRSALADGRASNQSTDPNAGVRDDEQSRTQIDAQTTLATGGARVVTAKNSHDKDEGNDQSKAAITINVSLSPELAASVTGTETLFVFARASNGPPVPLAAQRLSANQLPITVILDDSKSMSPQFAMSSTDSVVITARISRAGTPRAAPGDLQGTSTAIATRGAEVVDLLINQRVE